MSKRVTSRRITQSNELSVNPFKLDALQVEELRQKLAKRANQRLLRLERTRLSTGERASDLSGGQYAYEQISKIRGEGFTRFREGAQPLTSDTARKELYAIQSFLSAASSRAGNVQKFTSKTQQTFLERGVTVASYKSFYTFLNSNSYKLLKESGLDSEDIIDIYQRAHEDEGKSFKKINQIINEYLEEQEELQEKGESGQVTLKGLAESLGLKVLRS